jgi:hypothetical protein
MSDQCISGRHNYAHLGTSCADMDEQLRVMREVALSSGALIVSERGPVWSLNGETNEDVPAVPDGISAEGVYYSTGHIGTARDDDAKHD